MFNQINASGNEGAVNNAFPDKYGEISQEYEEIQGVKKEQSRIWKK